MTRLNSIIPMLVLVAAGCSTKNARDAPSRAAPTEKHVDYVHEYLRHNPALLARDGDKIVKAPEEDSAVARQYPDFSSKGPLHDGRRITIMTAKSTYRVGEEIRVIHVLEAPEPGHKIYVMGPKPIENEFVDGKPASPERTGFAGYNGRVADSPGVDFNYEVSTHRFNTPGEHTIQWKGGGHSIEGDLKLESNTLRIVITR